MYVYQHNGTAWVYTTTIARSGGSGDFFGHQVSLSSNGVLGISVERDSSGGASVVYELADAGNYSSWVLTAELRGASVATGDACSAVLVAPNGLTAFSGCPQAEGPSNVEQSGAVRIFTRASIGGAWSEGPTLAAPAPHAAMLLGSGLQLQDDLLFVYAASYNAAGAITNSGGVAVFETATAGSYAGAWELVQWVTPQTIQSGDACGVSVTPNGRGDVAIGCPGVTQPVTGMHNSGAVFMYHLAPVQSQRLVRDDAGYIGNIVAAAQESRVRRCCLAFSSPPPPLPMCADKTSPCFV